MQRNLSEILGKKDTKIQRLECYLALTRDYELAGCRLTVRDTTPRWIVTKYSLSDDKPAVKQGRLIRRLIFIRLCVTLL